MSGVTLNTRMAQYPYSVNRNQYFRAAQQNAAPAANYSIEPDEQENDDNSGSLVGNCLGTVGIWGGIKTIPFVLHPTNSMNGLSETFKIFKANRGLTRLAPNLQAEAFYNLYTANRLTPQLTRGAKNIAKSMQTDYIKALKSGNTVQTARKGAELSTFVGKNTKWFKKPTVAQARSMAREAGTEAARIAKAAKAEEAAMKNLSGLQKAGFGFKKLWKEGGGWFCVILESLGQIPELLAAFTQGKFSDGVTQTVKSAAKVGINTTGWILGAAAGKAAGIWAGVKLGAFAGPAFAPGVGSMIGAVAGFVGSLVGMAIGSHFADKISKAVVGKSFTEKQAEKQAMMLQLAQQQKFNSNPFYRSNQLG